MELNAEQIKKALECCLANDICDSKCGECQYKSTGADCMDCMLRDALALINSQEQKIKELPEELTIRESDYSFLVEKHKAVVAEKKQLAEENERLRAENEILLNIKNLNIDKVRADTVRKMQERITAIFNPDCSYDILQKIDQIAKELTESDKL